MKHEALVAIHILAGLSFGCSAHPSATFSDSQDNLLQSPANAHGIPGEYIVVLKPGLSMQALRNAANKTSNRQASDVLNAFYKAKQSGAVLYEYEYALQGLALRLTDEHALEPWREDTQWIQYIEPNFHASLDDEVTEEIQVQHDATWALSRLDQHDWNPFSPDTEYHHPKHGGQGVRAYVIDTGIYTEHQEFCQDSITPDCVTRIAHAAGFSAVDTDYEDTQGHGTHVAGSIGGLTYGVAKAITLIPVKVLDGFGSGSAATVIAGVDHVTQDAAHRPSVANMSLAITPPSQSVNDAVRNSIASGIVYAASAGNRATEACTQSPASVAEAITVGATDLADRQSYFSNYGSCVDIAAPGEGVISANVGRPWAVAMHSGTSMAAPHAAGTAALFLQRRIEQNQDTHVSSVVSDVLCKSTPDRITEIDPFEPNLLVFTGHITDPDAEHDMPQRAEFELAVASDSSVSTVGVSMTLEILFSPNRQPCFMKHVAVSQEGTILEASYDSQTRTITTVPVHGGLTRFQVVLTDGLDRQASAELELTVKKPPEVFLPVIR